MRDNIIEPTRAGRLLYREFEESDADELRCFIEDPSQLEHMLLFIRDEAELADFMGFVLKDIGKPGRKEWHFALEEAGKPGFIGAVDLMIEHEAPSSAELGYWFKREAWGKGYATEASRFMLDFGFRVLKLHRIWGKCHVRNAASARVMEKLGMTLEGTVREHVWLRDHWRSSRLYSMLEHEWRGK